MKAREIRSNLSAEAETRFVQVVDRPQARAERVKTLQEQLPERLHGRVEAQIRKEAVSRQSGEIGEV